MSFDSGVLIAYERADARARAWLERGMDMDQPPLVSTIAIAECWRDGRTQARLARLARLLHACDIRGVDFGLARRAGEALRDVPGASTTDALIAATAAQTGALLVTGDVDDMRPLAERHFRSLRLAALHG